MLGDLGTVGLVLGDLGKRLHFWNGFQGVGLWLDLELSGSGGNSTGGHLTEPL